MKLFKGSKKLKDELIKEIKAHQEVDEYMQGDWYNEAIKKVYLSEDNSLNKFAKKYNFDLWYVFLTERIFKGLPKGEFESFPLTNIEVFLKDGKLPKTVNWNKIKSEFFYKLLDDQLKYCKDSQPTIDYVKKCRDLFKVPFNEIDKKVAAVLGGDYAAIVDATYRVFAVARAAAGTASGLAAYSRVSTAAYRAADAVARAAADTDSYSANAAAYAVARAAVYSARKNHYIWMRDLLFKCVKNNITF